MCGIAGLLYRDDSRPCPPETLAAMRDIVDYRGPDDSGSYIDGAMGLGHRRLSIIDLAGGHQPMADASKRLWVVFNGEIYNYREVRARLIAQGHEFHSGSDTEVILALYREYGERCVQYMNGMFAFAIWDRDHRQLFLARDRMGVKPLYFADTAAGFVFGSEVKSIFSSGCIQPVCREEALAEYLTFRQVAGPATMFRGVESLPPGCTMVVGQGRATVKRYWSPLPSSVDLSLTFGEAVETLDALLQDAVRLRLISDVPVGTFCSGGIDSSLVTALAAHAKDEPVNTFSVGFDEIDYDESQFAQLVSKRFNTNHHRLNVGNIEFNELFPRLVWHNDEPLDFANSVHIFALSRLAKRHVTVVLTGEGSDELFAGYPRYRLADLGRAYGRVPAFVRNIVSRLGRDHRLQKLDRFAGLSADDRLLFNPSYSTQSAAAALCPELPALDTAFRRDRIAATDTLGLPAVTRSSLLDQETFLVSILNRQDKMSMAASIESRVPFMDYRIVEFANRLPLSHKLVGSSGKAVVKAVARKWLPAQVVDRRKSGFGVPLKEWLRSTEGLGERLRELPNSTGSQGLDRDVLRRLIAQHHAGSHDHSELLWAALNLATWREAFRC